MSSLAVNGVPSVLSLVSLAFFITASVGYSDKKHTLRQVPWITAKYSGILGSGNVYFGLRTIYNAGAFGDATIDFGEKNCPFSFCDECKRDGDAALGLLIAAIFLTFFEVITCCASTGGTTATTQWVQMAVALTAAVLSLVAVDLFMNNCYDAIDRSTGFDLHWGAGASLAILGMLLMWIDVVAHIVGAVYARYETNYNTV